MQRVLVLGPGAAGKSVFSQRLGEATGLPVVELDKVYWGPNLAPLTHEEWVTLQLSLISRPEWILDGDLGPYDVLETRLEPADTVVVLHPPLRVCLWRALRRSRERWDFWLWLMHWRRDSLPALTQKLVARTETMSPVVDRPGSPLAVQFLRSTREIRAFLEGATRHCEAQIGDPAKA